MPSRWTRVGLCPDEPVRGFRTRDAPCGGGGKRGARREGAGGGSTQGGRTQAGAGGLGAPGLGWAVAGPTPASVRGQWPRPGPAAASRAALLLRDAAPRCLWHRCRTRRTRPARLGPPTRSGRAVGGGTRACRFLRTHGAVQARWAPSSPLRGRHGPRRPIGGRRTHAWAVPPGPPTPCRSRPRRLPAKRPRPAQTVVPGPFLGPAERHSG